MTPLGYLICIWFVVMSVMFFIIRAFEEERGPRVPERVTPLEEERREP